MNSFRGEFQVEVDKKKVECLLTMNALRIFSKEESVKLSEFDKYMTEDPLTAIPTLAYYSHLNYRIKNKIKGTYPDKELFIMEVLDSGQLDVIGEAIGDAMNPEDEEKVGNVKAAKK